MIDSKCLAKRQDLQSGSLHTISRNLNISIVIKNSLTLLYHLKKERIYGYWKKPKYLHPSEHEVLT